MKTLLSTLTAVAGLACATLGAAAQSVSITVDPSDVRQTVKFGTDIKLTVSAVDSGNTASILDGFQDLGFDLVRVPIFASRTLDPQDPFYDVVWRVSDLIEDRGMLLFASPANGDGEVGLPGEQKHGDFLKSATSSYTYGLDPDLYAAYLDTYLNYMRVNDAAVTYLGLFNEDPAGAGIYSATLAAMTDTSPLIIGGEYIWLQGTVSRAAAMAGVSDIVGSHFFDDDVIADASEDSTWANLITNASPKSVWFTESTRFGRGSTNYMRLVNGLNHIIPAIQGGVERVVIYQGAPRLVNYQGVAQPYRYSGTKQFIASAAGSVVASTTSDYTVRTANFLDGNILHTNITNTETVDRTVTITLSGGYLAQGNSTQTNWSATAEGVAEPTNVLDEASSWTVTVPAQSYVHISTPVVLDD